MMIKSEMFSNRISRRLTSMDTNIVHEIDTSRGVFIYGAGELGLLAMEYCELCHITICGFVDKAKSGLMKGMLKNYPIFEPNAQSADDRLNLPILVAIATQPFVPIAEYLSLLGWENIHPFYSLSRERRPCHPLGSGWVVGSVTAEEKSAVSFICDNWADMASLAHYEAFLAWHADGSEIPLTDPPISPDQRYVIDPLVNMLSQRNEQMVDVGCHHGEGAFRLLNAGIEFAEYIMIEPDSISRAYFQKEVLSHLPKGSNAQLIDAVIGGSNSDRSFVSGLGYCSQLWDNARESRQTKTLDSFGLKPDLLKIHTEGSELDVLIGGMKTIHQYRPALAFSVYHNRDGLCRIIAEAMQYFKGYAWYFRLHSYQGTGGFVYAVPN